MNEKVNYKNDIVDQDEDLELFQQLLDNNPTPIDEVAVRPQLDLTQRRENMDYYLDPKTWLGGRNIARAVNSRYIEKDQIHGWRPWRMNYNQDFYENREEFREAKQNARHNKQNLKRAMRYAGSDQKSAEDRQFYHNLGNITTGVVSLPAIGLGVGAAGQILSNPIVQGIGAIDGLRNLFTGNGVQKTYNHFKNGEYGRGTLSLAGDILDASPLLGVFKAIKSGNEARKIFGNGVGLNYTLNEMPILNLFNRDNRVGFELAKIPFQEPIYRTGYHVTRYAGDEAPYLFPDEYVDNLGNKIKLDNYNPVRNPDDNLPINTYWRGGDEINYTTARPEIGLHVGATESPGRILMSRQHYGPERTIPPVVREVTWIDYPNSTRTMPDMNRWMASSGNKKLWEDMGVTIDDSMLEDNLYKSFNWYYDNSTTRNIEALNRSNAFLNGLRRAGITSIQYGNKYEVPWGWKHIDGNFYSTPTGRKLEWPGGESYAIITPESWWSKNRRYIPSIPEKSIPFDWNARNRVFNQTGLGLGKNSPGALHASDPGSVYRITGEDQITDLLSSGYVRPKQSGKVKGGRTNEVHWSAGDDNLYYYDGRPVIEVKTSNISENSPVTSEDIKALYRKVNGEYIDVWPNIKPKIIQGFNLGGKL